MVEASQLLQKAIELHQAGQWADAIHCYQAAIQLQPTAIAHLNLGILLEQADRSDEALASYTRAVELDPRGPAPQYHLGAALEQRGRWPAAMVCFQTALASQPAHGPSLARLAALYKRQGNLAMAEQLLLRAVAAEPKRAGAHFDLANVLQLERKWSEAINAYRAAIELVPDYFEAHNNLANALRENHELDDALACAQRAIELSPTSAAAVCNLGVVLEDMGRLVEAQARYEQAISLDPGLAAAHNNLGTVLKHQGHVEQAIEEYERALQIDPGYPQARCSRGMARLSQGQFEQGWADYEYRIGLPQFDTPSFPQPRWDGGPLDGRRLLIHSEQGLGDTIQFVRYLKQVHARAGQGSVIVAAPERLLPLLAMSGCSGLVSKELPLPPFDVHVPLMSLPYLFETRLETIPREIPYLAVESARVDRWRGVVQRYPGFRLGIAWQGRPDFRGDSRRSIPLADFEPLARVPGVSVFSLQRGPGVEQSPATRGRFTVIEPSEPFDQPGEAFLDTAAAMQALDLVITSDTATAHLAGALGVDVWVALSFAPDWRWILEGDSCPWYPSMRLFRQTRLGQWSGVLERMAGALRQLAS